jgi:tight adherence protein B
MMINNLWIITGAVFIAALLAAKAIFGLITRFRQTQQLENRRLAESKQIQKPMSVSNGLRRERGLADLDTPFLRPIFDLLTQSGLRLDRYVLLSAIFMLSFLLWLVLGFFTDYSVISFLAAVLLALVLAYFFFVVARQRRIARFAEQIPDAIDVLGRGVRVGYPLPVALRLVAREMPDPIGKEFRLTADEISFGQEVKTAIDNLYRRVGQEDLQFLVVAINVQNQTGGNLAEILSRLSHLVRTRAKLHLKIQALSAEGRMSAKFLSLMPFILFAIVSLVSPAYFNEVRHHPLVVPALLYGAISLVIGNIVMYRMVNFKF